MNDPDEDSDNSSVKGTATLSNPELKEQDITRGTSRKGIPRHDKYLKGKCNASQLKDSLQISTPVNIPDFVRKDKISQNRLSKDAHMDDNLSELNGRLNSNLELSECSFRTAKNESRNLERDSKLSKEANPEQLLLQEDLKYSTYSTPIEYSRKHCMQNKKSHHVEKKSVIHDEEKEKRPPRNDVDFAQNIDNFNPNGNDIHDKDEQIDYPNLNSDKIANLKMCDSPKLADKEDAIGTNEMTENLPKDEYILEDDLASNIQASDFQVQFENFFLKETEVSFHSGFKNDKDDIDNSSPFKENMKTKNKVTKKIHDIETIQDENSSEDSTHHDSKATKTPHDECSKENGQKNHSKKSDPEEENTFKDFDYDEYDESRSKDEENEEISSKDDSSSDESISIPRTRSLRPRSKSPVKADRKILRKDSCISNLGGRKKTTGDNYQ